MRLLKVLVYGDIDLNFMDGSAVWLVSLSKMLVQNKNIKVDLLLKAPEKEDRLVSSLKNIKNLRVIQPYDECSTLPLSIPEDRLDVSSACKIIKHLDDINDYHLIITRGQNLALSLTNYSSLQSRTIPYVTDFEHDMNKSTIEEREILSKIYDYYNNMFLQTEHTRTAFKKLINVDGSKINILYPMIPNIEKVPNFYNKRNQLIYAGKFHEDWHTEQIIDVAQTFQYIHPNVKFLIVGDKFQDALRKPEKQQHIKSKLKTTSNIDWVGAVSREQSQLYIEESDLGIAWRSARLDNNESVELSSKVLEYGRLGKPALLRRTKMHEEILGVDYPLFVSSEKEFELKTINVLSNFELYQNSAKMIFEAVQKFTFSQSYKRLHKFFWSFYRDKTRIVFAGHDLKFAQLIIEEFRKNPDYEVKIDQWDSHTKHDEKLSKKYSEWADVVFCEWGLGNVSWYSKHKKEGQKLIVRLHFQEKDLNFLRESDIEKVDKFIVITPYMFEEFCRLFDIPRKKVIYIDNLVRNEIFESEKISDCKYNLGIIGILPARKRLDLAIDIFEELWQEDNRYRLFIKGKRPEELEWLMARKKEREYYECLMRRIYTSPWRDSVIFENHGNDIGEWFKKIGHLLSTSDYEGSHVAVSEAMASGTHPVIINWAGATTIYPEKYIFNTTNSMIQAIKDFKYTTQETDEMKEYAQNKFKAAIQNNKIFNVIESLFTICD